jgi:5-methylcytosine-specific restriction endonuclease McrA
MPLLHACPNCGTAKVGTGRCTRCTKQHNRQRNQRTKHTEIWNTPAWRQTRALVLTRDDHTCTRCGKPGTIAHHHHYHDPFNPDTCTTLCHTCSGVIDAPKANR